MQVHKFFEVFQLEEGDVNGLFESSRNKIYYFSLQVLGNPTYADEVAQETLLRVVENIDTLKSRDKFNQWLFGIARNIIKDHFKTSRNQPLSIDYMIESGLKEPLDSKDDKSIEDKIIKKEDTSFLLRALQTLPYKRYAPLFLSYIEGKSYKEIGELLGMTLYQVKNAIHRGKMELRVAFEELSGEQLNEEGSPSVLKFSRISRIIYKLRKDAFLNCYILELIEDSMKKIVQPKFYVCRYPEMKQHSNGLIIEINFAFGRIFIIRSSEVREAKAFMEWLLTHEQDDFELVMTEEWMWPLAEQVLNIKERSNSSYYLRDEPFSNACFNFKGYTIKEYNSDDEINGSYIQIHDKTLKVINRALTFFHRFNRKYKLFFVIDEEERPLSWALFGETCVKGLWELHSFNELTVGSKEGVKTAIYYGTFILLKEGAVVMDGGLTEKEQERMEIIKSLGFEEGFRLIKGTVRR